MGDNEHAEGNKKPYDIVRAAIWCKLTICVCLPTVRNYRSELRWTFGAPQLFDYDFLLERGFVFHDFRRVMRRPSALVTIKMLPATISQCGSCGLESSSNTALIVFALGPVSSDERTGALIDEMWASASVGILDRRNPDRKGIGASLWLAAALADLIGGEEAESFREIFA